VRDLSITPLSIGGMVDRSVALAVRHFRTLFLSMLVVQAPAVVLLRLQADRIGPLLASLGDPVAMARAGPGLLGWSAAMLVLLSLLQFAATAAVAAVVAASLRPAPPGPAGAPSPSLPRRLGATASAAVAQLLVLSLAPVLGTLPGLLLAWRAGSATSLALGLATAGLLGLVAFLVALLRTVLAPVVAVLEARPFFSALLRSSRLMAPRPGQPFLDRPGLRASLLLLVTFVLVLAINGLASLPRALLGGLAGGGPFGLLGALPLPIELGLSLFETCAGAALQPFSLAALAVFYFERLARTEGLDLTIWAERLEAA
jgi:hypothetical protein